MKIKFASSLIVIVSALFYSTPVLSWENFTSNTFTPYPPGCVTNRAFQDLYYPAGTQVLFDGDILLDGFSEPESLTVRLMVNRTGCAENNRSFLWVWLGLNDDGEGQSEAGVIPTFYARFNGVDHPLRPTTEPNNWINMESLKFYAEGSNNNLILDVPTPLSPLYDADLIITPEEYNAAFTLVIENPVSSGFTVEIPSYNNELQPSYIPLNGRLSGIWVVDGAADQGFLISFSELPGNQDEGLIFFSWYTV